jgi:undecaprenyl phosphate-alpha-L-ara4N flippase subunit ArnE
VTVTLVLLCLAAQVCLATGQLFVKHAMNHTDHTPTPWPKVLSNFALGIGAMTGWFFLWTNLMKTNDLSHIYPFEGVGPVLVVLGAWFFLKEKIHPRAWLGIGLISLGLAFVAAS